MKRHSIVALTSLLIFLFSVAILILLWGVPQITSNSLNAFDALSAIIASIILAVFSGGGLLIILNKKI